MQCYTHTHKKKKNKEKNFLSSSKLGNRWIQTVLRIKEKKKKERKNKPWQQELVKNSSNMMDSLLVLEVYMY